MGCNYFELYIFQNIKNYVNERKGNMYTKNIKNGI